MSLRDDLLTLRAELAKRPDDAVRWSIFATTGLDADRTIALLAVLGPRIVDASTTHADVLRVVDMALAICDEGLRIG